MQKLVYLFVLFILVTTFGFSQNLVKNGSFEIGECPDRRNNGHYVCESWNSIGSADYFTTCSKGEVKPEDNFMGSQIPFSGMAYVGIFSDDANEVLYTKLLSPLRQGEIYRVSFRYSLAENSGFINKSLGCAFSNELAYRVVNSLFGVGHSPLFELNYSLIESDLTSLSDDKSWSLFEKEFTALGGERFLYISGVPGTSCIKREEAPPIMAYADYAYYYIDEVSVVKQNKDGSYPMVASELVANEGTKEEKDYIFSNIYFQTNSYQLNHTSKSSLDMLAKVLEENPEWGVAIQGHTDAVGNEKENLTLSESRANAVKDYLLSKGIEVEKIKLKALGSSIPLSSNASEEERAKNRRVEISLLKD
jgi:outer membrane protein OmpA-like peptidoglycan-associated protein